MTVVGVAAAIGFLVIAVFQLALAFGAPLGRAAWGGTHDFLPTRLRIASAVAAGVWVLAASIVLALAGVVNVLGLPPGLVRVGTWVLVGVLPLGAVMNLASPSRWERFVWAPFALGLAVLCFVLARSGSTI